MNGPEERAVQFRLTWRMALKVRSLCATERRRRQRDSEKNAAKGWKPEPGKYDANLALVAMMDDVIAQIEAARKAKPC